VLIWTKLSKISLGMICRTVLRNAGLLENNNKVLF
jgi:hypothetical protein